MDNPKTEKWFCWKEYRVVEGESPIESGFRLLTPWSDSMKYEFPMDLLFKSPKEAVRVKEELAPEEDWWLCTVEVVPVKRYNKNFIIN